MIIVKLLFILIVSLTVQAQNIANFPVRYSLINCSWPCPISNYGCVVTTTGANCQMKGINSWIINAPTKAPVYTGFLASGDLDSCIPAPIPRLPAATQDSPVKTGQSVIMWPILSSSKPLDEYLGNCRRGLYCSSAGTDKTRPVCRQILSAGSTCISSNQCSKGLCRQDTCQSSRKDNIRNNGKSSGSQNTNYQDSHNSNTTITDNILGPLFGSVGALVVSVAGICTYCRYRQRRKIKAKRSNENYAVSCNAIRETSSVTLSSESLPPYQLKEEQFASDRTHEDAQRSRLVSSSNPVQASILEYSLQQAEPRISYFDHDINYRKPPPSYIP